MKKQINRNVIVKSCGTDKTFKGGSRVSSPEGNLVNCTWYAHNSCCKRTEVTSVFREMYPLHGATRECSNRMNYLMCYFCSPQQYDWYDRGANVCASFCQTVYEHCQLARFRGKQIGEAYSSGNEFCEGQHFHVVDSNAKCFQFDKTVFSQGMRHTYALTALG